MQQQANEGTIATFLTWILLNGFVMLKKHTKKNTNLMNTKHTNWTVQKHKMQGKRNPH